MTEVEDPNLFVQKRTHGVEMFSEEQCIRCGVSIVWNISSLCVRWMDWLGYLAAINRTALGTRCGGANEWASRPELLPASAIGEYACRAN